MDFLKKISDAFSNLFPKKDQDNINVPPVSPAQNPVEEKPLEETTPEPEQKTEEEPIKQNFSGSEEEEKGL